MGRLFEQTEDTNPATDFRLSFGKSLSATFNITLANFLTWLNSNLTYPTPTLETTVVEIGDWDMTALSSKTVTHGLTLADIRSVKVIIWEDGNNALYDLLIHNGVIAGELNQIDASQVSLSRVTSGWFDSSLFNQTAFNRGFIVIEHV